MSSVEQLWQLLPQVYRLRDTEGAQSGYLRGLVEVLAGQADAIAEELAELYDNWFIETCAPWAVRYIGDLVGARPLHPVGTAGTTPRAHVANTIAARRRKGTAAALEQVARDVTGWPCHVVELYQLLAWSQFLGHIRLGAPATVDLHRAEALERIDGPFEGACRTADVRGARTGRPNIPDVALCVWRLEPFRLAGATAHPVGGSAGRYLFDPCGGEVPLANAPLPEDSIDVLATERHVPGPLRRRVLTDELDARRHGHAPTAASFFGDQPVLRVFADLGSGLAEVPAEELTVADLSDPPPTVTTGWRRPRTPLVAAVDPVLGRLAFRDGLVPSRVEVDFTCLAPGRVGAGPYDRSGPLAADVLEHATFARAVGRALPARPALTRTEVTTALGDWGTPQEGTTGVVAVLDSRTYAGPLSVTVPAGCTLLLTSGVWPQAEEAPTADETLDPADLVLDERRPVITGGLTVTGGTGADADTPRGRLVLDGLVIEGGISVAAGDLGLLRLEHTTVVPGSGPGVQVAGSNTDLAVVIDRCVTGQLLVAGEGPQLVARTSIVDGGGGPAISAPEAVAELTETTCLGDVTLRRLDARDCLLDGRVDVARVQEGCLSHCYLAEAVRAPRRYRCQPEMALAAKDAPPAEQVRARLGPQFVSREAGQPAYGLLADTTAVELLTGSTSNSEMGAFGHLMRAAREANLRIALEEYLPIGLRAGVIHVT
ncbi:MAG: hypothetical protein L0H79_01420 [Intrasporangium sp.]|uniref:hypothetical protein n=1 Tax=Intrasporangium sp. TaxID=1925024 RepID=UPI0026495CB1|nr:hypothetical protein [Intrasporangium sp.]MDN5794395.1 hypothetical protein [Intrasporangium sp.]